MCARFRVDRCATRNSQLRLPNRTAQNHRVTHIEHEIISHVIADRARVPLGTVFWLITIRHAFYLSVMLPHVLTPTRFP